MSDGIDNLEEVHWWLEALEENLLDAQYQVATDTETHFKIAAVRRLRERNEELETALAAADRLRNVLAEVIGKAL